MDTNLVYILCTAHSGHFSMTPISVWNFQHPMPALIYWWNMLVYLALGRRFRNKQSAHKTNNEFSVYLAIIIKFMFILYVLFSVIYLLLLFLSGWMHVCYSTINWSFGLQHTYTYNMELWRIQKKKNSCTFNKYKYR